MSSPKLAPQPNASPDTPLKEQLAGSEKGEMLDETAQTEAIASTQDEPGSNAGQVVGTAEEKMPVVKSDEGHVKSPSSEENAVVSTTGQSPSGDVQHVKADEPGPAAPADVVEQMAAQAEPMTRSTTPPPEISSKSAGKAAVRSPSPPPPPPKDDKYLSLNTDTPSRTTSPTSQGKSSGRNSEDAESAAYAKYDGGEDAAEDSRSEIQSIMEQFNNENGGPGADEIMSPRLELAGPLLESPVAHPPRRSSLEPLNKPLPVPAEDESSQHALVSPPPRASSLYRVGTNNSLKDGMGVGSPMSPPAHASQFSPAPPVPDPEPDLPFDFHRFLEQLRHRTADPVAKFLRSFLLEFGKKQWMVHEQVKIIADFLEFISKKMAQCDVWRTVSDAEFDNAREGMEKLVMNRLYSQTFSPAIPPTEQISPLKGRRRPDAPGRKGQHQEDVERDEVLAQRVRIYAWVKEEHLDINPVGDKGKKFLNLAQQELLKIKSYRAPRDKVICILNCCKVIFGLLRTSSSDQSADSFVPLLIYTVLHANPDHLVSNVQYILRFRNQDKLGGEAGYYLSSLMGAIQFIESLDRTSLTITDDDFEKNVEAAVSAIAERHVEPAQPSPSLAESSAPPSLPMPSPGHRRMPSPHVHLSEKSSLSRPEVTSRNSHEAELPRRSLSGKAGRSDGEQKEEENAAVAGLLRTIQRPLSTIGRIFSDNDTSTQPSGPVSTPQPGNTPRLSPAQIPPRRSSDYPSSTTTTTTGPPQVNNNEKPRRSANETRARQRLSAEDAAARQASAEAEEARKIQRQEHRVVVETLAGMFPALDREVIDDVVRLKEGRVGLAVDACLALSNP
ncbi:hypothetical protein P154DRAFT_451685 [Amniculicola lignicola CBS 123094]|uniref:Uncharacterized protein n=1 Tax=Amniculicola lignicola CBS 123094 TaxID=1392246 RepID=A0A6A5VTN3_9PLEO|nr:hypothetical protein P154DRAFT_451685 [Amniculicola lignicola CBS 123094]